MKQYAAKGLKIVAVYDGRRSSAAKLSTHVKREKIGYPVLFDTLGRVRKRLKFRGYPMAFLIGDDGKVQWQGILGSVGQKSVQAMLKKHK